MYNDENCLFLLSCNSQLSMIHSYSLVYKIMVNIYFTKQALNKYFICHICPILDMTTVKTNGNSKFNGKKKYSQNNNLQFFFT